jgi:hypothetical protein
MLKRNIFVQNQRGFSLKIQHLQFEAKMTAALIFSFSKIVFRQGLFCNTFWCGKLQPKIIS